jgi:hypothetical protein
MKWKGKSSKTDITAPTEEPEVVEENPKEYVLYHSLPFTYIFIPRFFVCKAKDCITKMAQACSRFLECGHVYKPPTIYCFFFFSFSPLPLIFLFYALLINFLRCAGTYNDLASECFCLKESCCVEGKQVTSLYLFLPVSSHLFPLYSFHLFVFPFFSCISSSNRTERNFVISVGRRRWEARRAID